MGLLVTNEKSVVVRAGEAFVAKFKREPVSASDCAWLNGYVAAAVEPTGYRCEIDGPHFYECKHCHIGVPIGEPPADRKSALDEIVRISEEAGLYDPTCAHSDMERVDGHICTSCGGYRSLDEPDAPLRHPNRTGD